jgi:hypothetical protein
MALIVSIRAQKPASQATAAEVVDIPVANAQLNIKAGNIRITFSDGHAEVVGKNGNCMDPHVSGKGDVGWTQCTEFNPKGCAMNEKLIVTASWWSNEGIRTEPESAIYHRLEVRR